MVFLLIIMQDAVHEIRPKNWLTFAFGQRYNYCIASLVMDPDITFDVGLRYAERQHKPQRDIADIRP